MPRIHAELAAAEVWVGRKRVARLMRTAGIVGVSRRRWIGTTVREPAVRPAPDLVERQFRADEPNRLWVADATHIPTWAGFLYLAIVLDVFSRKVGLGDGDAAADRAHARGARDGARAAPAAGRDPSLGPGCQYTSIAFGLRCQEAGVRPSMGSVGDA